MTLPQLQQRAIHPQRLRGPRTANGACDGAPSNRSHEPHLRKAINTVKNDLLLGEDVEQQAQRGSSKITLLASQGKSAGLLGTVQLLINKTTARNSFQPFGSSHKGASCSSDSIVLPCQNTLYRTFEASTIPKWSGLP
jgi:hypothetical protein